VRWHTYDEDDSEAGGDDDDTDGEEEEYDGELTAQSHVRGAGQDDGSGIDTPPLKLFQTKATLILVFWIVRV